MDVSTLVMIAALTVQLYGEQHTVVLKEETQIMAQTTLANYQHMITKENYKRLGFETVSEVKSATLGEPILDYMIRLDELKKYEMDMDPGRLLKPTNQAIYPVMIGKQTRSSFSLAKIDKSWSVVAYGSPILIRTLTKLRSVEAARSKQATGGFFSVRIPAFNLYLLGHSYHSKLMLAPVFDDSKLGLKAGEFEVANTFLQKLKPAAEEHNGLPR